MTHIAKYNIPQCRHRLQFDDDTDANSMVTRFVTCILEYGVHEIHEPFDCHGTRRLSTIDSEAS